MKVKHVMTTNLIVADVNTDLNELAKIMKENDIGFIPISEKNKIVGVLTDRDIIIRIIANKDNKIKDYFSNNLITIDLNENLENALELMGNKKIKRLLVSDKDKLVGIISISDIINNVDNIILFDNLKKIWEINRNMNNFDVDINDFYL